MSHTSPPTVPLGTRMVAAALHGATPDTLRTPHPAHDPASQVIVLIVACADDVDTADRERTRALDTTLTTLATAYIFDAAPHRALHPHTPTTDPAVADAVLRDDADHLASLLAIHNATSPGADATPGRDPDPDMLAAWRARTDNPLGTAMTLQRLDTHPVLLGAIDPPGGTDPMAGLRRLIARDAATLDDLDTTVRRHMRDTAWSLSAHADTTGLIQPPLLHTDTAGAVRHLHAIGRLDRLLQTYTHARTHLRNRPPTT
ncbi:hypothetical protein [Embleya sp. NPDC059237]|uniref:hypothetical protein n=1 Tax=Embleya sp. NPDC059237 TaxID=3346784 RepID=UPI00369F45F2